MLCNNRLSWLHSSMPPAEFWWLDFAVPLKHGTTPSPQDEGSRDELHSWRDDFEFFGGERRRVLDKPSGKWRVIVGDYANLRGRVFGERRRDVGAVFPMGRPHRIVVAAVNFTLHQPKGKTLQ